MIPTIQNHRSVRQFEPGRTIPDPLMTELLAAAARASTVGNMQLYSIVVTHAGGPVFAELGPCHFGQPAAVTAGALVTFCADVHRFSLWCGQRGAEPGYGNLQWFVNAAIDALLASQNFSLEAEANGLGICYLGTTTYNAADIVRILHLPKGVVPVTTVAVGYPAEPLPPLTDRLPLEAVVHRETYQDYTPEWIDEVWAAREASEETQELLKANDLPNLARIFTERRYTKADNLRFSKAYLDVLRDQGMFEFELAETE
ncbi:MAG: nitroreductase family protein [Rikenellaceae bacterium]|nr:nitroreductase family protein [Rikenellaceae bacterium]